MALEMRCGPARLGSPAAPDGGAGPVDDGSGRPLTGGGLLDPSAGSETTPRSELGSGRNEGFGTACNGRRALRWPAPLIRRSVIRTSVPK
jgi:hypothetical protein